MLLDERVDLLEATFVVTNLNRMVVVTEMNACSQHCIIFVDIEDPRITCCFRHKRLFIDPTHKIGSSRKRSSNREQLLCEAIEVYIIHIGSLMNMLKVLTIWIQALKMADTY